MAHEVYQFENGEDSMAFTGKTPWHGLGQELDPNSPLEVWAAKAHLDWKVNLADVMYTADDQSIVSWKKRKVLYRNDTGEPLSVVSGVYKPVQPIEVLEFFRTLIDNHGFKMSTAGSLRGGSRIWALADMSKSMRIFGQDEVKAYLLLATSYDLSLATTACFTSVRVVCNNTLQWAYNSDGQNAAAVKVPHFTLFDADKVQMDLGIIDRAWAKFEEDATRMAERKINQDEAVRFFMDLYHDKKKGDDYSDVPNKTIAKLMMINDTGVGQQTRSAAGTVWGLVNAVSRFVDHEKGERIEGNRLNGAWFGQGSALKSKAWANALDYAKRLVNRGWFRPSP